jgi:hypothetical protein
LNELCSQLRDSGFDAWFLFGGLNAWNLEGEFLQGDILAQRKLNQVSAQQVFLENPANGWLVIDVSPADTKGSLSLFSHAQFMPFTPEQTAHFLAELRQSAAQYVTMYTATPLILLYTAEGSGYAQIEQVLAESELPPRFFLQGGAHAYSQFVTQQQMIGNGAQRVSTECSSCAR